METSGRPVAETQGDNYYAQIARQHWLGKAKITRVQQDIVKGLWDALEKESFANSSLVLLENLQLLESYLWPGFDEDSTKQHVLLLALLVNIKRRENLPSWTLFANAPNNFSLFFRRLLSLALDTTLSSGVRTYVLLAVIGAFQSLDQDFIRKECAPLVSIATWHNLHSEAARSRILEQNQHWKKAWRTTVKRYESADDSSKVRTRFERSWLYTLILDFINILYNPSRHTKEDLIYCERFLEFLSDLQSQFPTRRHVNTLIKDLNLLVLIQQSLLYRDENSGLLRDFFILLRHFTFFPIDDHTGRELSSKDVAEAHHAKVALLQRTALRHYKDKLTLLALANYGSLDQRDELRTHLDVLDESELQEMAQHLGYRTAYPASANVKVDRTFLMELLLFAHEKLPTYQDVIGKMPILATEMSLYDPSFRRNETYNGSRPLAIPKLNLQYLTLGDFLWRSFILYRSESFYEIRSHLEDTVKRMQPKKDFSTGKTRFTGSSRMALPIPRPAIIEILPPKVGEDVPAKVTAEITLDVSRLNDKIRKEWEALRPDDVIYLLAVEPSDSHRALTNGRAQAATEEAPFKYLRSAEVSQVLDENGRPMRLNLAQSNGYHSRPRQRRLIVKLDATAHQEDAARSKNGKADIYESINLVVRRRSRENNSKAILESVQRLALANVALPSWLQDVFLGFGDPAGATFRQLPNALKQIDFRDTFLDWPHLVESFPHEVVRAERGLTEPFDPPFVLSTGTEVVESIPSKKRRREGEESGSAQPVEGRSSRSHAQNDGSAPPAKKSKGSNKRVYDEVEEQSPTASIRVSTYTPPNQGPYPSDVPKLSSVRFTPAQIEAIRSGTQPGLTIVVGPPGTGKTDVATQVVNNIYHNYPEERTLLIAHSNQALNQLFEKIVALDIDARHLLRLGHGENELQLDTDASYGKYGRVESFLENGARHLAEVNRLAASLGAPGAHGNSCETAAYFNAVYIKPTWQRYWDAVQTEGETKELVIENFPFHQFFSNAPQPLFDEGTEKSKCLDIAHGCYRHIQRIFAELEDIRPFEVLRNAREKANYLLVKEARIIAMTSTHAAMRRQEIANLGFQYDNVIMEEAAQITEVENFIPLVLQNSRDGAVPLKRLIMCGDHLQNSPIVQNLAFRQYANLEQSMFLRLVRLGVPTVMLDKQGRARSSLAELYKWRYENLGNLPVVDSATEYRLANAGLRYDYQFIQVPDYKGRGETEPSPHFIQNLGEAEYAVALYMFMRLLGYPASKISILTTYAGQRALIKDVLTHRCAKNRLFGLPRTVTTVDKYQGEQNDYILLSLTRTSRVGYLRDIRRLTVALSRARLGLYIFGRREVFQACFELKDAFERLFQRPDKLHVVVGEMFGSTERVVDEQVDSTEMDGVEHLGQYVFEMTQAKIASLKAGREVLPAPEKGMDGPGAEDDEEFPGGDVEEVEDDVGDVDDSVPVEGLEELEKAE